MKYMKYYVLPSAENYIKIATNLLNWIKIKKDCSNFFNT